MLDEWQEFLDYTGSVTYAASGKNDTTYLGRFTFDTLLDFEGLARVLMILARGYLFHMADGSILQESPRSRIGYARRALCAWCSVPDRKTAPSKETWQFKTDFRDLHQEFPDLVDEDGTGWFCRHVHAVAQFIQENPGKVRKTALEKAEIIEKKFDTAWRNKVLQYQVAIFSPQTKGAWTLRFDDVIADALELGPPHRQGQSFLPCCWKGSKLLRQTGYRLRSYRRWLPTTSPISQRTAIGSYCLWRTLKPTSEEPASARSIYGQSRKQLW